MEKKAAHFSLDALKLSWAKSDLLRFNPNLCGSCRNLTAVLYFLQEQKSLGIFSFILCDYSLCWHLRKRWLVSPLCINPSKCYLLFSYSFTGQGKYSNISFIPCCLILSWLQEDVVCKLISSLSNLLLQINPFDSVRRVRT